MKKTLIVSLIACIILIGSSLVLGQEDFIELVKTGSLEEVKRAIEAGANVNARDEIGMTPLMQAAWFNQNPEVIKVLLEAGAEINTRTENGMTPLFWAAWLNENPEVIKVLLEAGTNVDARDKWGSTPLMQAAGWNENPEVIKVLLEAGADGKIWCKNGKTTFDYAKENEHLQNTEVYWLLNDAQYL